MQLSGSDQFDQLRELVFEHNPPEVLPLMKLGRDSGLRSLVSTQAWDFLASIWPNGEPFSTLEETQPWAVTLFAPALVQKTVPAVETVFMQLAAQHGKPVHFLETGPELIDAFSSAPIASLASAIESFAANPGAAQPLIEAMYAAWVCGDAAGVYDAANSTPSFRDPLIRNAILGLRNKAWSNSLRMHMASQKRTLIAVGVLHVFGPGNAIEVLGCATQKLSLD